VTAEIRSSGKMSTAYLYEAYAQSRKIPLELYFMDNASVIGFYTTRHTTRSFGSIFT